MIILNSLYDDLEEKIESISADTEYGDDKLVSVNDEEAILLFEPAYRVTDKNIIAVEGVYGSYDEKTRDFQSDWSLTAIYDNVTDDKFNVEKWLYIEQDAPVVAIHNFLFLTKK